MAEGQRGPTKEQRENLGKTIRRRREQLELTLRDVVKLTGMSITTWSNAETGKISPQGVTLAKINRALRWPPGTCHAIRDGEPVSFNDLEETASDDTADSFIRWVRTRPNTEPYVREFVLAFIAHAR